MQGWLEKYETENEQVLLPHKIILRILLINLIIKLHQNIYSLLKLILRALIINISM